MSPENTKGLLVSEFQTFTYRETDNITITIHRLHKVFGKYIILISTIDWEFNAMQRAHICLTLG